MKLFSLIYIAIEVVAGRNGTSSRIQELANDLDRIAPGASDWFVEWGREEALLESLETSLAGSPGSQPARFRDASTIAFYVFYKNPMITLSAFVAACANLARFLSMDVPEVKWTRIYTFEKALKECPKWLHAILSQLHHMGGITRKNAIDATKEFVGRHPQLRDDLKFSTEYVEQDIFQAYLSAMVRLWFENCIDAPAGSCLYNESIQRWVPSVEVSQRMTRFMLLAIVKASP